jgi:mannosyltransferase OCH1-like enzyme
LLAPSGDAAMNAIPKRIIQTDKSRDLPLLLRAASSTLRLHNPSFDYMFFDDKDIERFIDDEFPQYRAAFDAFPLKIQRLDFFRYLAVYRFGGFYFDTDVILAQNLDDLLQTGCVFPFEELSIYPLLRERHGMDWDIGNYAFGAAAGHPFLAAIIENCLRAQKDPAWAEEMVAAFPKMFRGEIFVLTTTGPGLISRTLAEYPAAQHEVKVLFPKDVRDPATWHCFGAYGVHFQQASWRPRKGFLRRRLYRLWESAVTRSAHKRSQKLGPTRSLDFKRVDAPSDRSPPLTVSSKPIID